MTDVCEIATQLITIALDTVDTESDMEILSSEVFDEGADYTVVECIVHVTVYDK
jgi:hypothetical protein